MRYQSIIRFLEYAHIDYNVPQDFNLSRAKKLVNAEFSMQPDGIIGIETFSYTKQDLLTELERSDFIQRLENHKRIWENKSLLDLLEKDKIDLTQRPSWFHLAYAPHFKEYVSEYFAPVFDRIMRAILAKNNLHNAAIWLDYFPFIAAENEEEALRSTRLYLNEVVKFFKNLNDESYKTREGELYMWHNSNWSAFFNKLPDSLLGYVDEIISAIINFTVRIQKSNRNMCYELSKEMLLVNNANFSLKQLVRSNHETYKKNYESRTIKGQFNSVNYIYILIVVIFWVARFLMSNSSSEKNNDVSYNDQKPVTATSAPTQTQEEAELSNEANNQFSNQRNAFLKAYQKKAKTGFHSIDLNRLASIPFKASKVYLFVEGNNNGTLSLDTMGFENLTSKNIIVDIIWGGNVYHHDLAPNSFIGFALAKDKNMDLIFDFTAENTLSDTSSQFQEYDQYIHFRKDNEAPYNNIQSELGSPNELPYLLHSQLKGLPVFIKINENMDKIYFDIQTEAKAVNVNTASI